MKDIILCKYPTAGPDGKRKKISRACGFRIMSNARASRHSAMEIGTCKPTELLENPHLNKNNPLLFANYLK